MKPHDRLIVLPTHHLHMQLMVFRNLSIIVNVLLLHQLLLLLLLDKLLLLLRVRVQLCIMLLKVISPSYCLASMSRRVFWLRFITLFKVSARKWTSKRLLQLLVR